MCGCIYYYGCCALYGAVVTLAYVVFALDAVDVAESHLTVIIDDRKGPETFSISIIKAFHHEYRHGGTTI